MSLGKRKIPASLVVAAAIFIAMVILPYFIFKQDVMVAVHPDVIRLGQDYTIYINLTKKSIKTVKVIVYSEVSFRVMETAEKSVPANRHVEFHFTTVNKSYEIGMYHVNVTNGEGKLVGEAYFTVTSGKLESEVEFKIPVTTGDTTNQSTPVTFNGTISVTVWDNMTGNPLENAIVWVIPSDGNCTNIPGLTDSEGFFETYWSINLTQNKTISFKVVTGKPGYNIKIFTREFIFKVFLVNQTVVNQTNVTGG